MLSMADTSEFIVKVFVQLVRNCLLECLVRLQDWVRIVSMASHRKRFSSKTHNSSNTQLQQMHVPVQS